MARKGAIDRGLLEEEFDTFVELEGDPHWLPLPADPQELAGWQLPDAWRKPLTESGSARDAATALWSDLERVLPRTWAVLTNQLHGLALLRTRERGVTLVYVFSDDGDLSALRGGLPASALPAVAELFPTDLAPLYQVHDGFVNLASDDGGPLPLTNWKTLVDPISKEASLVKIAVNGSDAFGFDISEQPVQAYAVWPDEDEVEALDDPWAFLDEMIASPFEDS
jgi:hypothetical protein